MQSAPHNSLVLAAGRAQGCQLRTETFGQLCAARHGTQGGRRQAAIVRPCSQPEKQSGGGNGGGTGGEESTALG